MGAASIGAARKPVVTARRRIILVMELLPVFTQLLLARHIVRREETNVTAPLTGYADRISVRAGEKIAFKVSSIGPGPYNAMLVRIVRGDPNPGGPPQKLEDESELFDGRFTSRQQHAWPGSYALVDGAREAKLPVSLAVEALIWPTLPEDGPQTVISRRDPATGAGFALVLTPDGMALECGGARVAVGRKLRNRAWYRVWASADPATGMMRVGQQPLKRAFAVEDEGEAGTVVEGLAFEAAQPVLIGAELAVDRPARRCFNGKIEAPRVAGLAAWDFARRMGTLEVEDTGPNGLHGRLVNLPTRAMKARAGAMPSATGSRRRICMPRSISMTTTCTIAAGPTISASPCRRT